MPPAALSQSRPLRFTAFTLLYVAQGVPIGLFSVALPAWLASLGATPGQVAGMLAVVGLPFAFKLVTGPLMDRFRFPSLGHRRPWVLLAQAGLVLAMAAVALVGDPLADLPLLTGLGFCAMAMAATQDVAVDGMAIDVLKAQERGRANALMAFGQVLGYSGFGALNGALLVFYGLQVTALVSALLVAVIFCGVVLVRERPGERLLPWTAGDAQPRTAAVPEGFLAIFRDLLRALFLPMGLLLVLVEVVARMAAGIHISVLPVLAVQELGYSTEDYAFWFGATGAAAAGLGVFVGPLIDRFGAARLLLAGLLASALVYLAAALGAATWSDPTLAVLWLGAVQLATQVFFVSIIAVFMGVCWQRVAATQFAIYMSLANLARSGGAALWALVAAEFSSQQAVLLMAGLMATAAALLLAYSPDRHRDRVTALDAPA